MRGKIFGETTRECSVCENTKSCAGTSVQVLRRLPCAFGPRFNNLLRFRVMKSTVARREEIVARSIDQFGR